VKVAIVIPLGWLLAFVVGRFLGLVPAVAIASALLGTLAVATHGRELAALLRPRPSALALGALAAAALATVTYAVWTLAAARVPGLPGAAQQLYAQFPRRSAADALVVGAIVAVEEILFRGVVQSALAARTGRLAAPAAALVYAAAHATTGLPLLIALALGLGLFWSLLRAWSGSLWPALVSHLAWDLLVLFVHPLG